MGAKRRRRHGPTVEEIAYGASLAAASNLAASLRGMTPAGQGENWLVTSGLASAARWDTATEVHWDHRVFVAGGPLMAMATLGASMAGNATRKAKARRLLTVPQWWPVGPVAVEVCAHQFGMTAGAGWWVWNTASVVSVAPGPGWSSVTVCFADDVSLQLWGPQVPALAVGLLWATRDVIADPRPAPPLALVHR